ncbi:MAG: hypothetical protein IKR00_03375 [Lachnospiraceae bacterium]|nr:hypothetical protein [Lachnospiraceae bacterium]
MNSLLLIRNTIIDLFNKADFILIPALKFLLAFFIFTQIDYRYGYMELLGNIFVIVVLSLVCAIVPLSGTVIIGAIIIILNCFMIDIVVGAAVLCLFLLIVILILRFVPEDSLAVLLTPIAFGLGIPSAIPLCLGLFRKPVSVFAGIAGVVIHCFLDQLPDIAVITGRGLLSRMELIQKILNDLLGHQELIISSIVFSAVILIVHLIRHTLTKYTYLAAAAAGAVLYLVLKIAGSMFMGASPDIVRNVIDVLVSFVMALVISFFLYSVDYKRTRMLQFEDDDYYYYVKAVPKRRPVSGDPDDAYDADADEYDDYAEENTAPVQNEAPQSTVYDPDNDIMGQTKVSLRDPSGEDFHIEIDSSPAASAQTQDPDGDEWKGATRRIQ